MNTPNDLREKIAAASRQGQSGREELLDSLKTSSVETLAGLPMDTWHRLGAQGMRELFTVLFSSTQTTSKESVTAASNKPTHNDKPAMQFNVPHPITQHWLSQSPTIRAIAVGFTSGVTGLIFISSAYAANQIFRNTSPVSSSVSSWPRCSRLTPHTDSCVYRVQSNLSWTEAASALEQDPSALHSINRHLRQYPATLPKGLQLIVWRNVHPLGN